VALFATIYLGQRESVTGCESCDERIKQMLEHPQAGTPATNQCPECGTIIGVLDDRPAPAAPGVCTAVNPRPRNPAQYKAACAATNGPVIELDATAAQPGMTVWHINDWRVLTHVVRDGGRVELHMAAPDGTATRHTSVDTPVYRLP
jgi:hypothetical protein